MSPQSPRHESLSIHDIELDHTNPRIQRALDTYGDEINAARIALALREGSDESGSSDTTFGRLRNSIIKNKKIINPIVINEKDGKYICVEGNTRLLIYRELFDQSEGIDEEQSNWSTIPCLIYTDAGSEEMDAIRLQAHLIGPRPWDPYSKARYLAYLWEVEYLSHDEIIEYCGGNKRQIDDSIRAYRMVEDVYKPMLENPEEFDHTRFSGFVEYQDSRVHRAVLDAGFDEKHFTKWLHDKKIERLEHVRRLPEIMENEEAKQSFLNHGSNEAIKILNQPSLDELMQRYELGEVLNAVRHKISQLGHDDIEEYKGQASSLTPVIDEAVDTITEFRNDINDS